MRIRESYASHAFSPQPCLILSLVDLVPIIARAWLAVASYLNVAHLGRWFRSGTYYMVTITKGVGVHPCTRPYRHRTTEAPSIPGASKPRDVIHQPDLDAGQPHHHPQFALGSTAVIVAAVHQTFANQTACADCSIESPSSNPCAATCVSTSVSGRRRSRRHLGVPRFRLWLSPGGVAITLICYLG